MSRFNTEAAVMLAVLFGIAVSINFTREQWRERAAERQMAVQEQAQREVAAQQALENTAREHAQYMARYIDSSFVKKQGVETIAIVAASDNGTLNSAISEALARHFKSQTVETFPSFFKTEFVTDGLFNQAFDGVSDLSQKLELGKFLDGLVLAREQFRYSQNPSLDNVTTADMTLEISVLSVSASVQNQTWTLTATGAGFKNEDARIQAEERVIKEITTDTNMTLN